MKGVVFTEFLDMVEAKFSPDLVDLIIDESELPSGGAYTAVGTYHHSEMIELLTKLSENVDIEVADLLRSFGRHLFGRFVSRYPQLFSDAKETFDFLDKVDGYIHVEVRKLYPDAQLPSIQCDNPTPDCLQVTYRSARPLANLAEGLIQGCIAHFGEPIELEMHDLSDGSGLAARFELRKKALPGE